MASQAAGPFLHPHHVNRKTHHSAGGFHRGVTPLLIMRISPKCTWPAALVLLGIILLINYRWDAPSAGKANTISAGGLASDSSGKAESRPAATKRDSEATRAAAKKWHAELLEKYPEFAVKYRDIPDEKNGYLQLILLMEKMGPDGLSGLKGFRDGLTLGGEIDLAAAGKWLAENKEILDQILRIAGLPSQSSKDVPTNRFAGLGGGGSEHRFVLLLNARYAMSTGDKATALRSYAAALNMANHCDGIEAPSLLNAVAAVGLRQSVGEELVKQLPQLAGDAQALADARALLGRAMKEEPNLERVAVGEWNYGMLEFFLPEFLGDNPQGQVEFQSPQVIIDYYSEQMKLLAKGGKQAGWDQVIEPIATAAPPSSLTEEEKRFLNFALSDSFRTCFTGFLMARSQQAMHDAALAIVAGESMPVEPLTGEPFLWDPATRTLSAPAKFDQVKATILPIQVP